MPPNSLFAVRVPSLFAPPGLGRKRADLHLPPLPKRPGSPLKKSGFPPSASQDGQPLTEYLHTWLAVMTRYPTKVTSEHILRSAHVSPTGGFAHQPWPVSAWKTYQGLPTPRPLPLAHQPHLVPTELRLTQTPAPAPSVGRNPPRRPGLCLARKKLPEWTATPGPHIRPLENGFNATRGSVVARNPTPPPSANSAQMPVSVSSFPKFVPEAQIPTRPKTPIRTPETNGVMEDSNILAIIRRTMPTKNRRQNASWPAP